MRALFISDLHITSRTDKNYRLLLTFLGQQFKDVDTSPTHLVLLGDVFDIWIGAHDWLIDEYSEFVDFMRQLRVRRIEVLYFEGNHDLYLNDFWGARLGVRVESEPCILSFGPWRVRLEHGDQMNPNDRGYLWLRWFLRTKAMVWLQARLPSRVVRWLSERASHLSGQYTRLGGAAATRIRVMIRNHARRVYPQEHFDFLIAGHVHIQDWYEMPEQAVRKPVSINLGTWLEEPVALELTESGAAWVKVPPASGSSHMKGGP